MINQHVLTYIYGVQILWYILMQNDPSKSGDMVEPTNVGAGGGSSVGENVPWVVGVQEWHVLLATSAD